MKKLIAGAAACAMPIALLSLAPPAFADTSDGTITVRVIQDRNLNGENDLAAGLDVDLQTTVTFSDGESSIDVETSDGVAVLDASNNTLSGGTYRVDVATPNGPAESSTQYSVAPTSDEFSPATSFVDVSDGADQDLVVGYVDYTVLGLESARIISAGQLSDVLNRTDGPEVYSIPADYDYQTPVTTITSQDLGNRIGSVYGVGVQSTRQEAFFGAYAKRGTDYGPLGPGGIYRVNFITGAVEPYAVVPNAGTTEHAMGANQDYAFRTVVGEESLGDLDVSLDGGYFATVNMYTDSVVVDVAF